MLRRVTKSLRLPLFTKSHNHISPICPTMIPSPMWSVVLDFSFAFATFIWVQFCKVIFSSSTSYFQIFSVLPRLILFPAPPDSISIQSVGGLAIRPGGLLTVTEDVVSQVRLLLEFSWASLTGNFEIEKELTAVLSDILGSPFKSAHFDAVWPSGGVRHPVLQPLPLHLVVPGGKKASINQPDQLHRTRH